MLGGLLDGVCCWVGGCLEGQFSHVDGDLLDSATICSASQSLTLGTASVGTSPSG